LEARELLGLRVKLARLGLRVKLARLVLSVRRDPRESPVQPVLRAPPVLLVLKVPRAQTVLRVQLARLVLQASKDRRELPERQDPKAKPLLAPRVRLGLKVQLVHKERPEPLGLKANRVHLE
jgi:hypothetical protein